MFLIQLFQTNPLQGVALILTLITTLWCLIRLRQIQYTMDRALVSMVGLLAVYQGLRMLQGAGWLPAATIDTAVNLAVAILLLAAGLVVHQVSQERRREKIALRMAEANERRSLTLGGSLQGISARAEIPSASLLDAAPLPMFAIGMDGCVSYWNHAAERLLGYRRDEVLGQRLPSLLKPVEMPTVEGRLQIVRKDGESVEGSVRSVPIRDSRGDVSGILTIVS